MAVTDAETSRYPGFSTKSGIGTCIAPGIARLIFDVSDKSPLITGIRLTPFERKHLELHGI